MRVSTTTQAQEGDSLAAQREALTNYINSKPDYVLVGEYMDDGISGQKWAQRDELQRMLADVREGKIDLILCTKMDRLHRSLKHFLDMQEILTKHNVKWLSIWEPMYDSSTPAGQLIINQMMSFAQFEAQNTGSRIKQVMDYKVTQGQVITGSIPLGYKIVNKRLELDENAENVKHTFEYYSHTSNMSQTLREIEHLPGFPRSLIALKNLLTNRMYIGEYRQNKSYCPPIVDVDTFNDVQRKLSINVKSSQKNTYIFSGLIICDKCGYRMPGQQHRTQKKYVYPVYKCIRRYTAIRTCDNTKTYFERKLERELVSHIKEWLGNYIFECEQASAPAADNTKKIAALEKKIARLKELFLEELITIDEYKADKEKFRNEITALASATPPAPPDLGNLKKILNSNIEGIYWEMSLEDRRLFWRSFVKEIRLTPKGDIKVVFL